MKRYTLTAQLRIGGAAALEVEEDSLGAWVRFEDAIVDRGRDDEREKVAEELTAVCTENATLKGRLLLEPRRARAEMRAEIVGRLRGTTRERYRKAMVAGAYSDTHPKWAHAIAGDLVVHDRNLADDIERGDPEGTWGQSAGIPAPFTPEELDAAAYICERTCGASERVRLASLFAAKARALGTAAS